MGVRPQSKLAQNQNTLWKNTGPPRWWRAPSFWSSDFHCQSDSHVIPSIDDRSRDSARNTVMPLWEESFSLFLCDYPASLFRQEASGNPSILNGLLSYQNWGFTGRDFMLSHERVESLHVANCLRSCHEAHLENLQQHWNRVLICDKCICPRRLL